MAARAQRAFQFPFGSEIPNRRGFIRTTTHQTTLRGNGKRVDRALVAAHHFRFLAIGRVPDVNQLIFASGQHALAVGRERHGQHGLIDLRQTVLSRLGHRVRIGLLLVRRRLLGFGFLLGRIRSHQGFLGELQLIGSLLAGFFEFLVLGFRRRDFLHGLIEFLLRIRLLLVEIVAFLLRFAGQLAFIRGHLGGGIGSGLGFVRGHLGGGAGLFGRLGSGVRPLERLIR